MIRAHIKLFVRSGLVKQDLRLGIDRITKQAGIVFYTRIHRNDASSGDSNVPESNCRPIAAGATQKQTKS